MGSVRFLNKGIDSTCEKNFFPLPKRKWSIWYLASSIEFSTKIVQNNIKVARVRFPIQNTYLLQPVHWEREFQIFKFWRASEVECSTHFHHHPVYPSCKKKNTHVQQPYQQKLHERKKDFYVQNTNSNQDQYFQPTKPTNCKDICIHNSSKNSLACSLYNSNFTPIKRTIRYPHNQLFVCALKVRSHLVLLGTLALSPLTPYWSFKT
jgi:hypothetical protein